MPAHSSHILQPLDVGCFGPLKKAYGNQVENLMRAHVNHITKVEFLSAFKTAFQISITEENIRGGFQGSGLVPLNPERVLSKLDVKIRTPTPPRFPPAAADRWISQTPHNALEANSQFELIKTRISRHQNSSPTSMLDAVDQFAKGTKAIMHEVALLKAEVSSLRKANETLSKRRRGKKTRIQERGILSAQGAQDLLDQNAVDKQLEQETRKNGSSSKASQVKERRCGNCGKTGHNIRTCQEDAEMSNVYSSE